MEKGPCGMLCSKCSYCYSRQTRPYLMFISQTKHYQRYMLPAIKVQTVHEISQSNVTKLDSLYDRYIRKWLSMSTSGAAATEGLDIKYITHLYKETHAVSHTSSHIKADKAVNTALDTRVARETQWSRKGSISVYSEKKFQNASEQYLWRNKYKMRNSKPPVTQFLNIPYPRKKRSA